MSDVSDNATTQIDISLVNTVTITALGFNSIARASEPAAVSLEDLSGVGLTNVSSFISVRTRDMRNVFQFQFDSDTIGDDIMKDTRFFVNMDAWPYDLIINPMHASCDRIGGKLDVSSVQNGINISSSALPAKGKPYLSSIPSQNLVKHDFIRHVAHGLFGTSRGVELFTNEDEVMVDLGLLGHKLWDFDPSTNVVSRTDASYLGQSTEDFTDASYSGILQRLLAVDVSGGLDANGKDVSDNDITKGNKYLNFACNMFTELYIHDKQRFNTDISLVVNGLDSSVNSIIDTSAIQPIPFQDGDMIEFRLDVFPHPQQAVNVPTGGTVEKRSYKIVLLLCPDAHVYNTIPKFSNSGLNYNVDFTEKLHLLKHHSTYPQPTDGIPICIEKSYAYSGEHQSYFDISQNAFPDDRDFSNNSVRLYNRNNTSATLYYPVFDKDGNISLASFNSGDGTLTQYTYSDTDNTLTAREVIEDTDIDDQYGTGIPTGIGKYNKST